MIKLLKKALAIALVFTLVMPATVFAETSYGNIAGGIQFTNETHHAISMTWRQNDIPESLEHYSDWFMPGAIVHFADAPTTLTITQDMYWGDGAWSVDNFNSMILNELVLPEGISLMDYLRPSYDLWESLAIFDRPNAERIPIPFNGLQVDELEESLRDWLGDWLDEWIYENDLSPGEYGSTVLAGASVTLTEGIYIIQTDRYTSTRPAGILVVGNVDDSVLRAYNQAHNQAPYDVNGPDLSTASTWAHEGITSAVAAGLVPLSLQNYYTNNITRAEFTALAVLLYETVTGREIAGRVTFSDTNDVNVQKAAYIGIVSGTGNNNFSPDLPFNREQAAVILSRLADVIGQPLPQAAAAFADNAQISPWASDSAGQVQAAEIMGGVGDNIFSPQAAFTREQSIVTILRLFEVLS